MRPILVLTLMVAVAGLAVDKDGGKFRPGTASAYKSAQKAEGITIAAIPYHTATMAATAFGKVNPYEHDILPVLLVIENGTGKAIRASDLKVEFVDLSNRQVEAVPAGDVVLMGGARKVPKIGGSGSPIPLPKRNKKGPLNTWEIEGRAFSAKLIPAGENVNGFVYFQTSYKSGSKLYVTGLKDAATGKDYFFFEVPIELP